MNKCVKTKDLFVCKTPYLIELFEKYTYPWEMLPEIKNYIKALIESGMDGFTEISEGVFVGENVKIYPTAVIEPPAIIGAGTEIRPGAYIRGNVITGENCVMGNSSEYKNCILLGKSKYVTHHIRCKCGFNINIKVFLTAKYSGIQYFTNFRSFHFYYLKSFRFN